MRHIELHHKLLENSLVYDICQKLLAYTLSKKSSAEIFERLKKMKAQNILDIGCATAFYRNDLKVKNYTGIDTNHSHIKTAKKRFPKDKFFVMSATALKFSNGSFDAVISKGVLHHLGEKELVKTLNESLRVTKKNGKVITLDAIQPTNEWNVLGRLLRGLDQGHHVKHWNDYKKLLEKHFVLKEHAIISNFPYEVAIYTVAKPKNV